MKSTISLFSFLLCVTVSISGQVKDGIDIKVQLDTTEIRDSASLKKYCTLFIKYIEDISPDLLDPYAEKIIRAAKEFEEDRILYALGYHLFYYHKTINNDLDKELLYATLHYEASQAVAATNDDPATVLSDAANNLGIAYHDRSEYYEAVKYYLIAVEQSKGSENSTNASLPFLNISNVYGEMGDLDNSLKYLQYSIPHAQMESDTFYRTMTESMIYLTLGRLYDKKDMWDSTSLYRIKNNQALEFLKQDQQANIQEHVCNSLLFAATGFLKRAELDSAKYYLEQSRSCRSYTSQAYTLAEFHYCLESGSCKNQTELFNRINNADSEFTENSLFEYFLELKESYYLRTNQFDKAYSQRKELHEYEMDVWSEERTKYILFADAQYENSQNQERLKVAERKRIQQELVFQAEKKSQQAIILTISMFLILLSAVAIMLYRLLKSRKEISHQLELKNKELAETNKTKTRFFANVSHELKTPLTLILNPLQKLVKSKTLSDDDIYLAKTAEKNSLDLLELTNQILELTGSEVKKSELNESSFNFLELLKFTYADFESLIKNKSVSFHLDYQGNDDLTIVSDRNKIRIILKNLIANAAKFTDTEDSIRLSAIENQESITIEVLDSGRGIHPNDLPHIFDRYYQTNLPKAVTEGGSGIGLAICKEYVTLLGGSIHASSEYGNFTRFTIHLPKVVASENISLIRNRIDHSTTSLVPSQTIKADQALSTVLIVEDNYDMMNFLKYSLQGAYNTVVARNGVEGLKVLEREFRDIDLIISDVMMPVMAGYEFLQEVKAEKRFAAIPFIMLTALSDKDNRIKGLRAGVDDYLSKPFNHEELIARIDNLLANMWEKRAYQFSLHSSEEKLPDIDLGEIGITDLNAPIEDLDWLSKLEYIVISNIADHSFTVDDLARKIAMSRSLLYRKVKQLTGLTPNSYISQLRYDKARFYLETKKFTTVKQVAYEVGFKDEKYFSRNYKKHFGRYPSDYL